MRCLIDASSVKKEIMSTDQEWTGATGLTNPGLVPFAKGNRCFLNASLQMLISIPSVVREVAVTASEHLSVCLNAGDGRAPCPLDTRVFAALAVIAYGSGRPLSSDFVFNSLPTPYSDGAQHDIHEFFITCLVPMFRDFPSVTYTQTTTPLDPHCPHGVSVSSSEVVLSIQIPPRVRQISLQSLIEYYTLFTERLRGDNQYHCVPCSFFCDATRTQNVSLNTEYLVLNLVLWDEALRKRNVHVEQVTEPLHLKCTAGYVECEPVCVVLHLGETARSGHYVVCRRSLATGRWCTVDDDVIADSYFALPLILHSILIPR